MQVSVINLPNTEVTLNLRLIAEAYGHKPYKLVFIPSSGEIGVGTVAIQEFLGKGLAHSWKNLSCDWFEKIGEGLGWKKKSEFVFMNKGADNLVGKRPNLRGRSNYHEEMIPINPVRVALS